MPKSRFADETVIRAAQVMTPELANFVGNVHGGHVTLFADNLAYVCASRYAGTVCTSAALDRVDFLQPVHVGELLHLTARVVYTGRTSLDVEVVVESENITSGETRLTTTCLVTLVAMQDGKAVPVPPLVSRTREDKIRYLQAAHRRAITPRHKAEAQNDSFASMTDTELDSLITRDQQPS